MGVVNEEQTHERRSSSMSFAMRWKQENLRLITITAASLLAVIIMFMIMMYGTLTKKVTISIDGQEVTVYTKQQLLQDVLNEQGIAVTENDRVSQDLLSSVKSGDEVTIETVIPIVVTADGEEKTLFTSGDSVAEALLDLDIELGELDKVAPAPETQISSYDEIQIVRVVNEQEEVKETIAYETKKQSDPKLIKGKEIVVQQGKEGVLVKTLEKRFEDGKLVSEAVVEEKVAEPRIDQIVAVGTKSAVTVLSTSSPMIDEVTKSGITFGYKQILNNVKLTAYTAGVSSTGKSEDHPQYGITASGAKVAEGRTIAVDPKVIPMGWWVYIEGLGFRRAEDKGSAVKGNKIDVYFDSEDYAKRFGTKQGYTVYVIGPVKPSAD